MKRHLGIPRKEGKSEVKYFGFESAVLIAVMQFEKDMK